jgi:hypothetical protein
MTKTAGMGDNFYIGGVDLSGDVNALSSIHGGPAALDFTTINLQAFARQGGLRDGGIDFTSLFDPYAAGVPAGQFLLPTTDQIASYFRGTAIGNDCASMVSKQVNWDPTRGTDGSFIFSESMQSNGFGLEWGTQLTPGIRTDGSATAASAANSFDTGGSLAFGAQMYVHLFAFAGTSVTIKVQDSSDNITFTDIAGTSLTTAALTTAPQAVRIAIPNTTTVRRYIAVGTVGTFTNAQFAVHVTKNLTAGQVF